MIFLKSCHFSLIKVGKDSSHFMRRFAYPLFPSALILENRMKWSKSLPALIGFLLKNPFNAGKDFDHFIRFSNMRADRNREEFELKARRIEISWIFIFSLWNLMEFYEMLWQILISLINFWSILINFDQFWKREWNGIFPSLFGGVRTLDFFVVPSWPKWPPVAPCGGHRRPFWP